MLVLVLYTHTKNKIKGIKCTAALQKSHVQAFSSYHLAKRIPMRVKIKYVNTSSHNDSKNTLTDSVLRVH